MTKTIIYQAFFLATQPVNHGNDVGPFEYEQGADHVGVLPAGKYALMLY